MVAPSWEPSRFEKVVELSEGGGVVAGGRPYFVTESLFPFKLYFLSVDGA